MAYDLLTLEIDHRLALVRLNRPAARNALSQALMRELIRCAQELAERTDIDVVLLTGNEVCLSAGADLKDARAWADDALPLVARREIAALGYRMCKAWEDLPQITLVAIEGYAVGGALALSLACDWRVMADDAFVSLPEIALGDKRVLVIGGKPVPFCLARIPQGNEVRGNLAAGGLGVAQPLSARDREIAEAVGPVLAARGLLLAGIDVIGECITEINVTSPTCFQEIFDQTGFDVAAMFVDALEAALATPPAG